MNLGVNQSKTVEAQNVEGAKTIKNASMKRYIVIAAVIVIAIAIVVGGMVFAFSMHVKGTDKLVKHFTHFMDGHGHEVNEQIEIDLDDNTVVYTVEQESYGKFLIIHDYNKKIAVLKDVNFGNGRCVISTIMFSMSALQVMKGVKSNITQSIHRKLSVDYDPVLDTSFLPPLAQSMCQGLPAYWAVPKCAIKNTDTTFRKKRQSFCLTITLEIGNIKVEIQFGDCGNEPGGFKGKHPEVAKLPETSLAEM